MKKVTKRWLNAWKTFLVIVMGFPTLGYTWLYLTGRASAALSSYPDSRGLSAVVALETWLHFWRFILLLIAGFPTLGYTWSVLTSLDEPIFIGLRKRYTKGE